MSYRSYKHHRSFLHAPSTRRLNLAILTTSVLAIISFSVAGISSLSARSQTDSPAPSSAPTTQAQRSSQQASDVNEVSSERELPLCSTTEPQFGGIAAVVCVNGSASQHYEHFAPDAPLETVISEFQLLTKDTSTYVRAGTSEGSHRFMALDTNTLFLVNIQSTTIDHNDLARIWKEHSETQRTATIDLQ
jgi:hypothetical protein